MKTREAFRGALLGVLALGLGACNMLMPAAQPGAAGAGSGTDGPPAGVTATATTSMFIDPYVSACDSFSDDDDKRVRVVLDAIQGKGKQLDGSPFQDATDALAKLQAEKVDAHVDIPERGFPTVKTSVQAELIKRTQPPPTTDADKKKVMALSATFARINPVVLGLNQHLYTIQMAQIYSDLHGELCSAYPATAALAMVNANRQGVLAKDDDGQRAGLRKLLASSYRARTYAATIMGVYANYQAAVAGAMKPDTLDAVVDGARKSLDDKPQVSDADVDAALAQANEQLKSVVAKEAELKKLAAQTMRPPPPKPSANDRAVSDSGGAADTAAGVMGLLGGIATGNPVAIIQNAAKILPEDSPVGSAVAGVAAITKGDFRKALSMANNLAPPGPLKSALGTAQSALAMVDQAKGVAKNPTSALR